MIVEVDPESPVPPYEQLREQIMGMIVAGTLAAGKRLPPIRQLSADLSLAPGTVARAYRELEASGVVETLGRRGTRVAASRSWGHGEDSTALLRAAADRYVMTARQLGVSRDQALDTVADRFSEV